MICVDASVAGRWLFTGEYSSQADALLDGALQRSERMVAPPFLPVEVTNTIRQYLRRRDLSLDQARALLAHFLAIPIELHAPPSLYDRALLMADQYNLPAAYDAHYVALAEHFGATLWTADRRLVNTLGGRLPFVRWIGEYDV